MQNAILKTGIKLLIGGFLVNLYITPVKAQQDIIANKDNTRPETARQYNSFNTVSFKAIQQGGYNDIEWPATPNDVSNRFVLEYSFDGINFLSAEQVMPTNGIYKYQHHIQDTRPLLYRLRVEDIKGATSYSGVFLPKGVTISPVQIQNNVVTGNVLNANAQFPVERIMVTSGNGIQQFTKDINGLRDFIPIALPSLNRGIYFITFFGNGWKSTGRFVVG